MLIFAPQKLIHAVEIIKQQHPLTGSLTVTLSGADLKELVLRIDSREMEELEALALSLSRRQIFALCGYLPNNAYHVDLGKITRVISFRMNSDLFLRLFQLWQRHPQCLECLSLAGKFDTDEFRPQDFPVKKGLLAQWSGTTLPLLAVAQTTKDLGKGTLFEEKYRSLGLEAETELERISYLKYLLRANKTQIKGEGDPKIFHSLASATNADRVDVLCQILRLGMTNYSFLLNFPNLYRMAHDLWGEPNRRSFPNLELFPAYAWWCNYHKMSDALSGDRRRIKFWQPYLDRCTCAHYTAHEMLIFRFKDYVATEFEVQGPVYIFRKEYFDDAVSLQMGLRRTSEFKSWLYNHADYESREVHSFNWESNETAALRRVGIR